MDLFSLQCSENIISSLEPLKGMKLRKLECGSNLIDTLEPLRGMPLISLGFTDNTINSLAPVADCSLLASISCRGNAICSLEALRGMNLKRVTCSENRITSLEPLSGMPLSSCICVNNPLKSLDPFIADPPEKFFFYSETLPEGELARAFSTWSGSEDAETLSKDAQVLLAIKRGRYSDLRKYAVTCNRTRYLFVPAFVSRKRAHEIAQKSGAFLFSFEVEGMASSWRSLINRKRGKRCPINTCSMLDRHVETWNGFVIQNGMLYRETREGLKLSEGEVITLQKDQDKLSGFGFTGAYSYYYFTYPERKENRGYPERKRYFIIQWDE
jgi:hypothetical protein